MLTYNAIIPVLRKNIFQNGVQMPYWKNNFLKFAQIPYQSRFGKNIGQNSQKACFCPNCARNVGQHSQTTTKNLFSPNCARNVGQNSQKACFCPNCTRNVGQNSQKPVFARVALAMLAKIHKNPKKTGFRRSALAKTPQTARPPR